MLLGLDSGLSPRRPTSSAVSFADAVAADSPYLWAKMDETSGTVMANSGSYSTVGTYNGGVTINQPSLFNDSGKSIILDGATDWCGFTTAAYSDMNATRWTLEFIMSRPADAAGECIWHTGDSGAAGSAGYMVHCQGSGEIDVQGYAGGAWRQALSVGLALPGDGTVNIIAIRFDSVLGTVRFFKNGSLVNEAAWAGGNSNRNVADLVKIGIREHMDAIYANSYLNASLDDVIYWNDTAGVSEARLLVHAQAAGLA